MDAPRPSSHLSYSLLDAVCEHVAPAVFIIEARDAGAFHIAKAYGPCTAPTEHNLKALEGMQLSEHMEPPASPGLFDGTVALEGCSTCLDTGAPVTIALNPSAGTAADTAAGAAPRQARFAPVSVAAGSSPNATAGTATHVICLWDAPPAPTDAPVAKKHPAPEDSSARPEATPEVEDTPAKRRILAVEDNNSTRRLLERMLAAEYDVDTAATVDDALDLVAATQYDAVLLDINLNERRTGVEVLHHIRGLASYQSVPVIACTAYVLRDYEGRFRDVGFTSVVQKPFTKRSLSQALEAALEAEGAPVEEAGPQADIDLDLPPLPTTLPEIVGLIAQTQEDPDVERLTQILQKDSVVSFWLLRHMNSAYYNLRSKISTVERAVMYLGFRPVCNLALTEVLKHHMGEADTPAVKHVQDYLVRTGLGAALYAQKLATRLALSDPEVVFAGGMLFHLGRFLLLSQSPVDYAGLWTAGTPSDQADEAAPAVTPPPLGQELLHCGIDSNQLGIRVAKQHHFSETLRTILQTAGRPERTSASASPEALVVTLRARAAHHLHVTGPWDTFGACRATLGGATLEQLARSTARPAEDLLFLFYEEQGDVQSFINTVARG